MAGSGTGSDARMIKYIATIGGLGLAAAFVAVFFVGRSESRQLGEVAQRVGMTQDDLLTMGPRVAAATGATLGSARHVVYMLACSGLSSPDALEAQATRAGALARRQLLSDREAVVAVLAQAGHTATPSLEGC